MRTSTSKITRIRVYRIFMTAIFLAMLFSSSWICHGFYLGYSDAGLGKSIRIIRVIPPAPDAPAP